MTYDTIPNFLRIYDSDKRCFSKFCLSGRSNYTEAKSRLFGDCETIYF